MMARIKALYCRRYEAVQGVSLDGGDTVISVDDLKMNVERHEVTVAGKQVDFTLKEFELLKYLLEHRGHVFSRDQLLNNIWGIGCCGRNAYRGCAYPAYPSEII